MQKLQRGRLGEVVWGACEPVLSELETDQMETRRNGDCATKDGKHKVLEDTSFTFLCNGPAGKPDRKETARR